MITLKSLSALNVSILQKHNTVTTQIGIEVGGKLYVVNVAEGVTCIS